ncbi:xanthine dehydrogenase family protein subunit M [Streptomyces sp. RPA4-5]|uniref:FAD binding domain-containing protein n=1 Tax=Streptomyces TaxID=1883 RepID=UPI00143E2F01|nr:MULTISPECIES: xanthine dehydrogenase family protein subunit M [Streptomyces]MCX4638958.1 xanthine dehydrogenase family protein subunit M [Streptomyces platensis]QIY59294.1 xanthine dehydrogenase family protein subunit M [Streptomyces sp. RPA4-5]WJY42537.1 xanthine dehydrogenase family protein subunit M [Streptomyces sp. P9-2B-2]
MRAISYTRATDVHSAVEAVTSDPGSSFLAGGTTEVDLLRLDVLRPHRLVDINRLPLTGVEERADGGLLIGALARMSEVAEHPAVVERFPMLSQALLLGASAQLRQMASMGGNLMQRVRCAYYRDPESACNKRVPGSGCSALEGVHRGHAILGTSEHCIATHPSDLAVALVALDAVVHVEGMDGARSIPVDDFFLLPGDTPEREHPLTPGELITAIEVPALPMARRSLYLKVRDRESYEFALASTAAALALEDGVVREVRLALGGVATKPWRARRAEDVLMGERADDAAFTRAATAELAPATTRPMNAFKAELARRTLVRALRTVATTGGGTA